ncbi:efflux RND transporter periplasmic adaptor subunit [Pseudomonas sp. UL073]|uniref:Efflux RND transporter periplasmic adaptor subunit n=1 Tax=Zestomonas insulae TaxID=2809017 RepID=A0ABS2IG80_9GAMM|nr:efflux RND transporter periplasmic adaptor subunit [Pseudomonas insulae]MBM7062086.1 efflux RND transporter periplasmic adaptor subunit [Pseudomonas insulae]
MSFKPAFSALFAAVAVTTLLLSGCDKHAEQPAVGTPKVGVITLRPQRFAQTSELPGRTSAYRIAEVRPQVNGIILKRLFTEGSEVKAGQQLYQIDPATYQATFQSTQAALKSTQALAERYKDLVKDQAVSKQEYDEAQANFLRDQAAVDAARINLRYTKVLAPISGRIGRSSVSEGALVNSGQADAMSTIQQLDPIYVDVTQSTKDILRLRKELTSGNLQKAGAHGAKVKLTLEDGSLYGHEGTLEFSEVSVDAGTGSVVLRAVFPNPEHELLPGMFVHAQLLQGVKEQAILAPQQGITRNVRGEPTALVVNADNVVERRELKAEHTVGDMWLVSSGLNSGDRLITEGLQYVHPGDKVEVKAASNVKTPEAAAR